MKKRDRFSPQLRRVCFCCLAIWLGSMTLALGQEVTAENDAVFGEDRDLGVASDPLEPINRVFFHFNDKLYFWVLKPAAQGYSYFIAEDVRMCVRSFWKNISAPVRIVNNLLQGKIANSGIETARFVINSTLGIAGLADPAKNEFGLSPKDEDLGQTIGVYGLGEGAYICWPFLGPSNVRDTIGLAGDFFLNPMSYVGGSDFGAQVAIKAGKDVNDTSLTLGDYEDFKESAIDPYVSLRDAYHQYRQKKIRDIPVGNDSMYSSSSGNTGKVYAREMPEPVPSVLDSESVSGDDSFAQAGTQVEGEQLLTMPQASLAKDKDSAVEGADQGDHNLYALQVSVGQ